MLCTLHREGWSSGLIGQRGRFLRLALCTLGFLSLVITINSHVIFICWFDQTNYKVINGSIISTNIVSFCIVVLSLIGWSKPIC